MVVKDIVEDGQCRWPEEWIVKYPTLILHKYIQLDPGKKDTLVWKSKDCNERKFSVSQVYVDLSCNSDVVKWNKL
ncbi:hypothetical protein Tco_0229740, partial [Tanacetum coccineum]